MIAQALTMAVPSTIPNPGQSGHTLKSTALIDKGTGEILAERAGAISHPELYKRYERQRRQRRQHNEENKTTQ